MLQALRQRGVSIGLISNCTREEAAAWDDSPFADLVGVIKPNAEIYTFACSKLGVAPDNAHFVGDGGSDELRGADAAGLHPVWATWLIERWQWDWPANVADTAAGFTRCSAVAIYPR
jgi:putative hydrolase of the HAD superfamily